MKNTFIRILLIMLGFIGIGIFVILGYLGFIPGLSFLLGSTNPINLYIHTTDQHEKNAITKMGVQVHKIKASEKTPPQSHVGLHRVKTSLTQEEVTALSNARIRSDFPLSRTQIKLNDKDTIEISSILSVVKLRQYFDNLKVDTTQLNKILDWYKIPLSNIPIYIKAKGNIKANIVNIQIHQLQIGRFSVPKSVIQQINEPVAFILTQALQHDIEAKVNIITVKKNIIEIDGYWPTLEVVEK